jgi:poly(3-hydroxybutyrate) depolymerase
VSPKAVLSSSNGGIMRLLILVCGLVGCGNEKSSEDTAGDFVSSSDTASPEDGVEGLAILATLSSDDCPDMTETNTGTFTSSGEERTVTVVVPSGEPEAGAPLVYFFHGLLDPSSTPLPTEYMASALQLQSIADETGVTFVLPQSELLNRLGFEFFMWNVETGDSSDMVLFDDLRTCASLEREVDLTRVHAMGMSGGALFTTVVARERGDTLATMIEMSGGSDISMLTFDSLLSEYDTPAYAMPALLISGGPTDTWPGGGMDLVDFSGATDNLADQLFSDGHYVVRCEHDRGHSVPYEAVQASWEWVEAHQFGEESPFITEGIDALGSWCNVVD